ncbi:MAG: RraA family protein [Verrucomicrobia bacterium]|nr:RraA family protein [Verrucomicrobiota bacterium]
MKTKVLLLTAGLVLAVSIALAATGGPALPTEDDLIAGFKRSTVASVADAVDHVVGERGFMSHDVRPMIPGKVVGRAITALVRPAPPDKATPALAVKHSVEMIDNSKPGEVGVIVMEDGLDVAAIGGLMATTAKVRGMAGMVVDGGVRDLAEIRALKFPVYARSVTPATAVSRYASVAQQIPLKCAGITVKPGDIIVAGEDGVVRVPQEKAAEVLAKAREIDARETKMVPMIKQHKSLRKVIDLFNRI